MWGVRCPLDPLASLPSLNARSRGTLPNLPNLPRRQRPGLPARLADAVERVAEVVLPVKRVPEEYRLAVGAERENATPFELKELRSLQSGSGGRARTYDMVINSHPLCQLSYAGIGEKS